MGVLNASFLGLVLSSSLIWAQVSPREESVNRAIENLMCTCGCPHLIGQCGDECGVAPQLINEISALVDRGSTEDEVYAAFEAKYGLVVLAVPRMEGFNMLLWILALDLALLRVGDQVLILEGAHNQVLYILILLLHLGVK